jgi:hypothetical protein
MRYLGRWFTGVTNVERRAVAEVLGQESQYYTDTPRIDSAFQVLTKTLFDLFFFQDKRGPSGLIQDKGARRYDNVHISQYKTPMELSVAGIQTLRVLLESSKTAGRHHSCRKGLLGRCHVSSSCCFDVSMRCCPAPDALSGAP